MHWVFTMISLIGQLEFHVGGSRAESILNELSRHGPGVIGKTRENLSG